MEVSLTHLHLLLNHVPTVGFVMALGIFVLSHFGAHEHVRQLGLALLVGIALVAIPVYATGNAAQQALAGDGSVSTALVEMHEGAALLAFLLMQATGLFAWLGLWQHRRLARVPGWGSATVLALGAASLLLVARAAALGGEIRHPEIRVTPESTEGALARSVGVFVANTSWAWVSSEVLHFIGLSMLIGVMLVINLRMLGVIGGVTFRALDRLLPWAILGFGLNVITGMLFFAGAPSQYVDNTAFFWKVAFVVLAGLNTLYFTFDKTWVLEGLQTAPLRSRAMALSALVLWVGVLYWGTMLPFIGDAF